MKAFGKIESQFWDTMRHERISDHGKLLSAYLLTCKHGNMIGIFSLPRAYIMGDLNWDAQTVEQTVRELLANRFLTVSEQNDFICINKFMEHNRAENVKQMEARLRLLLNLPDSLPDTLPTLTNLISRELLKASSFKGSNDTRRLIDQVRIKFDKGSDPVSEPLANDVEKVRLENKRNREVENKREKTLGASDAPSEQTPAKSDDYSPEFEHWWSQYPEREGRKGKKKTASGYYNTRLSEVGSHETLLRNLMAYSAYCDASGKTGTQFVLQATTYLNDPDNVINPWKVNYENRQGPAGRPSLVDQVAEANRHLYEPSAGSSEPSGYHPEDDRGAVWDHDGPVRPEVDHGLRTGGPNGAMAGNTEGLAPAAVRHGDQPGTPGG